ncbi:DNA-directed RNA polymerases I and III subunit RPAC1 [Gigaspora margarita]|uniref:DNA-directed RNA polymerases I and III subunit RPAC1 n=1 Tax=Gigaspora margarita TaxID=4874 RepID=A0A8H4AWU6_GIGMA|nr:DNA-directed RNA polymerases I and III subunit RPAC1 [Gigaspora margarita]
MSKRNSKSQGNAERLEQLRTRVMIEREGVESISSSEFPYHSSNRHQDIDYIKEFIKKFSVKIIRKEQYDMEFDLIGVDAAIANALRRIMIAEVPTMAIEKVYIYNNTSIVQDEVLAHRLGLIPIKADPDRFYFKQANESPTDMNTIVFKIEHECTFSPKAREDETDPQKLYIGHNLLSESLTWIPKGDQEEQYASCPIRPVHHDILIAQMRPGQKIKIEAHCEKGIGKDHAKWSPVATASYRLMPEIILKKEITGDLADKFAACFTKGVVEVEDSYVEGQFIKCAKVVNPRIDMVSREVLRHKEFEDIVQLTRIRDHFIFNVESTGIMDSEKIFLDSVHILQAKCKRLLAALDHKLREQERDREQMDIY